MRLSQIAKDFDIKLVSVTKNNIAKYAKKYDMKLNSFKNNAYVLGDDEIILGIYDQKEVRIAAFFHEIGHTLVKENFEKMINYDAVLIEFKAWEEGLKVAKKYNYHFSNKTFRYILTSINSYYKDALNAYNTKR